MLWSWWLVGVVLLARRARGCAGGGPPTLTVQLQVAAEATLPAGAACDLHQLAVQAVRAGSVLESAMMVTPVAAGTLLLQIESTVTLLHASPVVVGACWAATRSQAPATEHCDHHGLLQTSRAEHEVQVTVAAEVLQAAHLQPQQLAERLARSALWQEYQLAWRNLTSGAANETAAVVHVQTIAHGTSTDSSRSHSSSNRLYIPMIVVVVVMFVMLAVGMASRCASRKIQPLAVTDEASSSYKTVIISHADVTELDF